MTHPLNWILRIGRSRADAQALIGDLEEEYRNSVEPRRGRLGAQLWYASELLRAAACGVGDALSAARHRHRRDHSTRAGWSADVRHAVRRWRRRPGFAVTAILTLGAGIGTTTATFAVLDAVALRPLPWPEADQLVAVFSARLDQRGDPRFTDTWNRRPVSTATWGALQQSPVFQAVAARPVARSMILGGERPAIVETARISANLLPILGVSISHGRGFTSAEEAAGNVVILTHEAWQRHFGGRSDIIGTTIVLSYPAGPAGRPSLIVGVAEPGFGFGNDTPEFLLPIGRTVNVHLIARLAPGVSIDAARAAAESIVSNSETRARSSAEVVRLADQLLGRRARPMWLLFAGSGLLLLVACFNVAGLLVAEARGRQREIALRHALGGSTWRICRQLILEHAMLAIVGVALGFLLSIWLTQALAALAPIELLRATEIGIDRRAMAFATGAGLMALLIFGVAPALRLAARTADEALSGGNRGRAPTRCRGHRLLVAGEIAVALVLLVAASLLGETLLRLISTPLGFTPSNLVIASAYHAGARQRLASTAPAPEIVERLSALPGVLAVASATAAPFSGENTGVQLIVPDVTAPDRPTHMQVVSRRYFEALGMRILRGRAFETGDRRDVAIVSDSFARRVFDGEAIGRRFSWGGGWTARIVGVVPDINVREFSYSDRATFYVLDGAMNGFVHFIVRTASEDVPAERSIRRAIAGSPSWVVTSIDTAEELFAESIGAERFRGTLSIGFGITALGLAALGLYGLAARRVADRRREFAVRLALGATPGNLRALVMRDAGVIVSMGLAVGLPGAFIASQLTRSLLHGVSPTAAHVFLVPAVVLALAACAAAMRPARRAMHIDPVRALKD